MGKHRWWNPPLVFFFIRCVSHNVSREPRSMYYRHASFAIGALVGLCLTVFAVVPFVLGVCIGFCLYEINPDSVRGVRSWALSKASSSAEALRAMTRKDFEFGAAPRLIESAGGEGASAASGSASEKDGNW